MRELTVEYIGVRSQTISLSLSVASSQNSAMSVDDCFREVSRVRSQEEDCLVVWLGGTGDPVCRDMVIQGGCENRWISRPLIEFTCAAPTSVVSHMADEIKFLIWACKEASPNSSHVIFMFGEIDKDN